jgi:hypothetical protein
MKTTLEGISRMHADGVIGKCRISNHAPALEFERFGSDIF